MKHKSTFPLDGLLVYLTQVTQASGDRKALFFCIMDSPLPRGLAADSHSVSAAVTGVLAGLRVGNGRSSSTLGEMGCRIQGRTLDSGITCCLVAWASGVEHLSLEEAGFTQHTGPWTLCPSSPWQCADVATGGRGRLCHPPHWQRFSFPFRRKLMWKKKAEKQLGDQQPCPSSESRSVSILPEVLDSPE